MTNPLQSRLEALDKPMRPIDIGHEFDEFEPAPAKAESLGMSRGMFWLGLLFISVPIVGAVLYGAWRFFVWGMNP